MEASADGLDLSLDDRVRLLRTELEEAIRPFDAFDVVAHMWFANTCTNLNTYVESEHDGLLTAVELCAALVAVRPSRDGGDPRTATISRVHLDRWYDLLRHSAIRLAMERSKRRDDSAFERYRAGFVFQQQLSRGTLYTSRHLSTFRALFNESSISASLLNRTGFSADDAERIYSYFDDVPRRRFLARRDDAIKRECERLGRIDLHSDNDRARFVHDLLHQPDEVLATETISRLCEATFAHFGDILTFRTAEISNELNLAQDRVDAFCKLFSSEMPLAQFEVDSIRDRPLLSSGGELFCVSAMTLLLAMRRRCEDALKEHDWASYGKRRSEHVESKTAELLSRCLKPEACIRNGKYLWQGGEYEFDLLIIKDDVALAVESKGGAISPPARRGASQRFERDIDRLLLEATEQAFRFRDALLGAAIVRDKFGCEVSAVKSIRIVYPIVITLEETAYAAANLWNLVNAERLKETNVPWAVCLHDLERIADLVELPATLIAYLGMRRDLARKKQIHMHDELDAFLHYLRWGLIFPEFATGEEGPDYVLMGSLTDELDAYYASTQGLRTEPAPKPRHMLAPGFLEVLTHLERKRPRGYVTASLTMMSIGYTSQVEVAESWHSCLERSAQDGSLHDVSFVKDGAGITYMTAPPGSHGELRDQLQLLCQIKHYQLRTRSWTGIGRVARTRSAFQCTAFECQSWQRRKDMDKLLDELGLSKDHATRRSGKRATKATTKSRRP